MESVTLKGTRAIIIPIICAIMLSGGTININSTSKSQFKPENATKVYNDVTEVYNNTIEELVENDFDISNIDAKKTLLIKNKELLKKSLSKKMTVTITADKEILAPIVLEMIYDNDPKLEIEFDQSKLDKTNVRMVGGCIQLENGGSVERGDRDGIACGLLTGSVVLNRAYYCSWCPDTIEGVLFQKGQYASHTVNNLKSCKIPDKVQQLAEYLLIFGPICPKNVIYQSQNPSLGKGIYAKIKTTSGYEYFAYGDD